MSTNVFEECNTDERSQGTSFLIVHTLPEPPSSGLPGAAGDIYALLSAIKRISKGRLDG